MTELFTQPEKPKALLTRGFFLLLRQEKRLELDMFSGAVIAGEQPWMKFFPPMELKGLILPEKNSENIKKNKETLDTFKKQEENRQNGIRTYMHITPHLENVIDFYNKSRLLISVDECDPGDYSFTVTIPIRDKKTYEIHFMGLYIGGILSYIYAYPKTFKKKKEDKPHLGMHLKLTAKMFDDIINAPVEDPNHLNSDNEL